MTEDQRSGAEQSRRASAGFFSSARSFFLPVGPRIVRGQVHGYPIDLRVKADRPTWPPPWLPPRERQLHVDTIQWGLGCHERFLAGNGEAWLAGALACGNHMVALQEADGGWLHLEPYHHTWPLRAPWKSAMAQGEGASLLVRLHGQTGEEVFADAARRALAPLGVPTARGGVQALIDGRPIPEEYPTDPPSLVLNGAMFALWGLLDAGVGLGDSGALRAFEDGVDVLAASISRWDTGWWSRYSLYPHPVVNPASSFYHALHIAQLEAMDVLAPRPALAAARARFQDYARSPAARRRAFAQKALFRMLVPRNRLLAFRLPWLRPAPAPSS